MSKFVSAGGDKSHPYFQCLKRNNRFVWTKECEDSFLKLKEYLASLLNQVCSSFEESKSFEFDGRLDVLVVAEVF